jgi:hypothetical protein
MTEPKVEWDYQYSKNDGEPRAIGAEELKELKDQVRTICSEAACRVWERKEHAQDVRFCRWDGQDLDGRRHKKNLGGKEAFPYEGAPDTRVRLADGIVNYRVGILCAAAHRATPKIQAVGTADLETANRLTQVMKWLKRNHMDRTFRREIRKIATYQEADSPGAGIMKVFWCQKWGIRQRPISQNEILLEFATKFVQAGMPEPQAVEEAESLLRDLLMEGNEEEAIGLFRTYFPDLSKKMVRKMVRELRTTGATSWPERVLKGEYPKIRALRLYEDVFVPWNTTDLDEAPVIVEREMLTRAEVEALEEERGVSREFLDEVLRHEGETGFPEVAVRGSISDFDYDVALANHDKDTMKGYYEVLTAYWRWINDDGISQVVSYPFSMFTDEASKDVEPVGDGLEEFPFVWFGREVLGNLIVETRGVPEVVATSQFALKRCRDAFLAHVELNTVPPIKVPRASAKIQLALAPLGQVPEERPNSITAMQFGQFPAANEHYQVTEMAWVAEYFGLPHESVPQAVTIQAQQQMIDDFTDNLRKVYTLCYNWLANYATPGLIERVTGSKKELRPYGSMEDRTGMFDFILYCDARDLDMEFLVQIAEIISKTIAPMDTTAVINREKMVRVLLRALAPELADETLSDQAGAEVREVEDEQLNYVKIKNGIEPPMVEGQNHQLRMQVLQRSFQTDPAPPQEKIITEMLDRRMQHHGFMMQQARNAMIGRVGAEPVMG